MHAFRKVVVPRPAALKTLDALQEAGEDGLECLVLWLARFQGRDAEVTDVWQPKQEAGRVKGGLYLHIGGSELARLNEDLFRTGQTLLAQVHSHPTLAYLSGIDEAKPVVTEDGAFSIVVPFFGFVSLADLSACAVFQIQKGIFVRISPSASADLFVFPA